MRRSKRRISASTDNSRREAEASLLFLRSHCRCRGAPGGGGETPRPAGGAGGLCGDSRGNPPRPMGRRPAPCRGFCASLRFDMQKRSSLCGICDTAGGERRTSLCADTGISGGPPGAGGEGGAAAGERAAQRAAAGFAASLRQQPVPLHRFLNEPRETALERRAANLLRDLRPPEQENGRIVRSFFVRIFRNGA